MLAAFSFCLPPGQGIVMLKIAIVGRSGRGHAPCRARRTAAQNALPNAEQNAEQNAERIATRIVN
jgi:hypothetical protein